MDILAYSSPIERKLVMEKWAQAMDGSFFAGDFVTLFAIAAAFGTAAITRLKASLELMSPEYRDKLKKYEQFPEVAGQYKKYQEEYKRRSGLLPFLGTQFSYLEFAKRGNKEPKASEIIHRLTDELVGKIENFIGKKLPESVESTTKIVTLDKDDYEMINKQQYDLSLKQEPRNLPANVLQVSNPGLRSFLLAKNVALTEKQLVQLNDLVKEPDEQALAKILAQLHISATNLEVKKFNSLNKQIYSIVSQASPVDKSVNEKYLSLLNKNVYADLLAEMIRNYLAVGSGKIISQSGRSVKEVMEDINKIIIDLATQPKTDRSSAEKYLRDLLIEIGLNNFSQKELLSKVVANLLGDETLSKMAIEVKQIANRVLFPINYKTLVPSDLKIKELRINSALERLNALLSEVNTSAGRGKLGEHDAAVQYLTREINQATIALTQLKMTLSTINQKLKAGELIIAVTAKAPIQYQAEKITPVVGADNVVVVALTGKELPASFDEFISSLPANARIDIIADLKQSNVALAIQEAAKKFNATARENLYVNYAKASSLAPVAEVKATVLPEEPPSLSLPSAIDKKPPIKKTTKKETTIEEKFQHTIKQKNTLAPPASSTTAPITTAKVEVQSNVKLDNSELVSKLSKELVAKLLAAQVTRHALPIMPPDKLYKEIKQLITSDQIPYDLTSYEVDELIKLDSNLFVALHHANLDLAQFHPPEKRGADDLLPLLIANVASQLKAGLPKIIAAWQAVASQLSAGSGEHSYAYVSLSIAVEYLKSNPQIMSAINFPEDFENHFLQSAAERESLLLGLKRNLFNFSERDISNTIEWVKANSYRLTDTEKKILNDLEENAEETKVIMPAEHQIDQSKIIQFQQMVIQELVDVEQLQHARAEKIELLNAKTREYQPLIKRWQADDKKFFTKVFSKKFRDELEKLRVNLNQKIDGTNKIKTEIIAIDAKLKNINARIVAEQGQLLPQEITTPPKVAQDDSLVIKPTGHEDKIATLPQKTSSSRRQEFSLGAVAQTIFKYTPRFFPRLVDQIAALFTKRKPAKHKLASQAASDVNVATVSEFDVARCEHEITTLQGQKKNLEDKVLAAKRNVWLTKHLLVPDFLLPLINPALRDARSQLNECNKKIAAEKKKLLVFKQELAVKNEISKKNGEIEDYSKKITELLEERNKVELEIFTTIKNSWLQGVATKLLLKPIKSFLLELFNPQLKDYEAQAKVNAKEIYLTLDHITRVLQSFLADAPKVYDANTVAKLNNDLNLLNNLYSQIHPNDKQGKLATQITTLREQIIVILLKYIDDRTTKGAGEKNIKQLTEDLQQLQRCAACKGINSKLKSQLKHEIAELERTIDKALQLKQPDKLSPNNTSALFQKEKPLEKGVTSEPEQEMKEDKKIQLKL